MAHSLEALCGTLLVGGFHGTEVPPFFSDALARGALGGAILFKRNLTGEPEHVAALNAALTRATAGDAPPLLAVDQEGGRVARIKAPALELPPMLRLASTNDEALIEEAGYVSSTELVALGFTMNFAPVLDVHTNEANPIIGDRAFGTEPERAARLALAFARGMAKAGLLACGKHFPGHGDTATDSHLELPVVDRSRRSLNAIEMAPFRRAIAARIPMLMTAHVRYPALDPALPATLSPILLTRLLRGRLGFRGVIASDDLEMRAIADQWSAGEASIRALVAGCDLVLFCHRQDWLRTAVDAVEQAVGSGRIPEGRIADAYQRVTKLMRWRHQHSRREPLSVIGCPAHARLNATVRGS